MAVSYNQPTSKPTAKIAAVGTAGIIVSLTVSMLAIFGVIVPDDLSAQAEQAVTAVILIITFGQALIQFIAGYMKKSEKK